MNLISYNALFPVLVEDLSCPYYDECCGLLSEGALVIREIPAELVRMYFDSVSPKYTDVRSCTVIESSLQKRVTAIFLSKRDVKMTLL